MHKGKKNVGFVVPAGCKFSPEQIAAKLQVRDVRLKQGTSLPDMAEVMGVTRKELEAIETLRDYGKNVSWDFIYKYHWATGTDLDRYGIMPEGYKEEEL